MANGGRLRDAVCHSGDVAWAVQRSQDEEVRRVRRASSVLNDQEMLGAALQDEQGQLLDELAAKKDHKSSMQVGT